jgi:hypothetical protein
MGICELLFAGRPEVDPIGARPEGDVTLTRAGRNSVAAVKFQATAAADFHSAIALKR